MSWTRKTRVVWQKLDCLNSNSDLVKRAAHRKNVWDRCHPMFQFVTQTEATFSG